MNPSKLILPVSLLTAAAAESEHCTAKPKKDARPNVIVILADDLGFEHFNERAFLSKEGWKIVRQGNKHPWELYDLNNDRSEQHDLAKQNPAKVEELTKAYEEWAKRCMVEPYPGQFKKNKK